MTHNEDAREDASRSKLAANLKATLADRMLPSRASSSSTSSSSATSSSSSDRREMSTPRKSISFTIDLVKAILDGRKTQTRRAVRPITEPKPDIRACRYGPAGELLDLREKWAHDPSGEGFVYAADAPASMRVRWQASRFMPIDAVRWRLRVESIDVERLTQISHEDARAEGSPIDVDDPRKWFELTWRSIYPDGEVAWQNDPWVWVVRFKLADRDGIGVVR